MIAWAQEFETSHSNTMSQKQQPTTKEYNSGTVKWKRYKQQGIWGWGYVVEISCPLQVYPPYQGLNMFTNPNAQIPAPALFLGIRR
jgi:hypothetical protein